MSLTLGDLQRMSDGAVSAYDDHRRRVWIEQCEQKIADNGPNLVRDTINGNLGEVVGVDPGGALVIRALNGVECWAHVEFLELA